jgi:hypothetical protein
VSKVEDLPKFSNFARSAPRPVKAADAALSMWVVHSTEAELQNQPRMNRRLM